MEIYEVRQDKKRFLPLLLLGDEQESQIDRYLDRGRLFVLADPQPVGVCVLTREPGGVAEIQNLAVAPEHQRRGYGRALVEYAAQAARPAHTLLACTGDSPLTLPFYEACGFFRSHVVPDYFLRHYDHPIYEGGVRLRDRVVLIRPL